MRTVATGIEHTTEHHCGFRDVDPFGHMSMVRYFELFADHRFAALRDRFGLSLREIEKLPIGFFTTSAEIEYKRPVFCDEAFTVSSKVVAVGEQRCEVECLLRKSDGSVASRCTMKITCVDMQTGRASTWPAGFIERFYQLEA